MLKTFYHTRIYAQLHWKKYLIRSQRISFVVKILLLLSSPLLPITATAQVNEPIFIASNTPPRGFESLVQPQTTAVDIYYGNRYLLTTLATFTPTRIEFHHPDQILKFIPDILEPGRVLNHLRSSLATHTEHVCGRTNQNRCGSLEPEIIEVIFDADRFRADIFINPSYLIVRDAILNPLLPESTSGTSFIQLINSSFSGQESEDNNYTLTGVSTLGRRQSRIQSEWASTETNGLNVDTFAWQRDYKGYEFQAGIIRTTSRGLTFASEQEIAGISAATTLNTRTDLAFSRGSEIQIFLPSRSRVEIFKDNRLVDTRFYDTGNQTIDTSRLPDGAYNILLRIRDSSGTAREETRFFVKSPKLPPKDAPQYFVQAGKIYSRNEEETFADETPSWLFRTGYAERLNDELGTELALLLTQGQSLLETGIFWFGPGYDLHGSLMASTEGDLGFSFNTQYRLGIASASYSYRRIWADSERFFDINDEDSIEDFLEQRFDPVPRSALQSTFSFNILLGKGNLGIQSRYNNNRFEEKRTSHSIRYLRPIFRSGPYQLNFSAAITKEESDHQGLVGINLRHSDKHWNNNLQTAAAWEKDNQDSEAGINASASATWNDKELYQGDIQGTLRAEKDLEESSVGAEVEYNSRLGQSRFAVEETSTDNGSTLQYGGNLGFSFIAAKDLFAFGGKQQSTGAAVINVDGSAEKTLFDIHVNGQRRGEATPNAKTVLSLAPYQTYNIRLRPKGIGFVDFNDEIKTITIYPGNVEQLIWSVEEIVVVFGRVLNEANQPVVNARISGALGLATSDYLGLFQAEIRKDTKELIFQTVEGNCKINISNLDQQRGVSNLGNVICREISMDENEELENAIIID